MVSLSGNINIILGYSLINQSHKCSKSSDAKDVAKGGFHHLHNFKKSWILFPCLMPLGYGQLTPAFWVRVLSSCNFSFVIKEWTLQCLVVGKEKLTQNKIKQFEWKVH